MSKPLRRHSKLQRAALVGRYIGQKFVVAPLSFFLLLIAAVMSGVIAAGAVSLAITMVWKHFSPATFDLERIFIGTFMFVAPALAIGGGAWLESQMQKLLEVPQGHFLNPLPPEPNAILPEEEVLIRAAMPNNSALLLRADTANRPDPAPETLLHPTHDDARA